MDISPPDWLKTLRNIARYDFRDSLQHSLLLNSMEFLRLLQEAYPDFNIKDTQELRKKLIADPKGAGEKTNRAKAMQTNQTALGN